MNKDYFAWIIFLPAKCNRISYYNTYSEFFTPASADGLSLESECQQVFSGFRDSSQYSSQSQQCYRLNDLDSSSDFQLQVPPLFQAFGNCSKYLNNNTITLMFHNLFFSSLFKSKNLSLFYLSLIFTLFSLGWDSQIHQTASPLFLLSLGLLDRIR